MEATDPRAPESTRGTIGVGTLAGVGISLVLTGVALVLTKLQLIALVDEIGGQRAGIGNGALIAGGVVLALGIEVLAYAYRLRRSVESWPIAAGSCGVAFVLTGYVVGLVTQHYWHALI